jgi:hypothetical protein
MIAAVKRRHESGTLIFTIASMFEMTIATLEK